VATILLLVLSGLSSRKSTRALEDSIYEKLNAVQAAKKGKIIDLIKVFERDVTSLSKSQQVLSSIFLFDGYLDNCDELLKEDVLIPWIRTNILVFTDRQHPSLWNS